MCKISFPCNVTQVWVYQETELMENVRILLCTIHPLSPVINLFHIAKYIHVPTKLPKFLIPL